MSENINPLAKMFREADLGLARYRNIIGIGVFVMLIAFSAVFLYTYTQEQKIAEKCGFIDEKIKCVCTKVAWEERNAQPDYIPTEQEDFSNIIMAPTETKEE